MTPDRQDQISDLVANWENQNHRNDFSDLCQCLGFEQSVGDNGLDERGQEANHEEALRFAAEIGVTFEELIKWDQQEIATAFTSMSKAVDEERKRRQSRKQRASRWDAKQYNE